MFILHLLSHVVLALGVLHLTDILLGAVAHFINFSNPLRLLENYRHALLGMAIAALATWQLRTGYAHQTVELREAGALWIVCAILIPIAYVAGLALFDQGDAVEDGDMGQGAESEDEGSA